MSFIIAAKKKLYGSENEVQERYVSASGNKYEWSPMAKAIRFTNEQEAIDFFKEHQEELLSNENVLRNTIYLKEIIVKPGVRIEVEPVTTAQKHELETLKKTIQASITRAYEILGDKYMQEYFLDDVKRIVLGSESDVSRDVKNPDDSNRIPVKKVPDNNNNKEIPKADKETPEESMKREPEKKKAPTIDMSGVEDLIKLFMSVGIGD